MLLLIILLQYHHQQQLILTPTRVTMQCLETGPYREHVMTIIITFTSDYPYQPPTVKFVKQIYHPNVDLKTGTVTETITIIIIFIPTRYIVL